MPNNSTKLALEASLKNLLLKKPVDKITITDLTNDCGITRMAFYFVKSAGTPGELGLPKVTAPLPACTKSESLWPW